MSSGREGRATVLGVRPRHRPALSGLGRVSGQRARRAGSPAHGPAPPHAPGQGGGRRVSAAPSPDPPPALAWSAPGGAGVPFHWGVVCSLGQPRRAASVGSAPWLGGRLEPSSRHVKADPGPSRSGPPRGALCSVPARPGDLSRPSRPSSGLWVASESMLFTPCEPIP